MCLLLSCMNSKTSKDVSEINSRGQWTEVRKLNSAFGSCIIQASFVRFVLAHYFAVILFVLTPYERPYLPVVTFTAAPYLSLPVLFSLPVSSPSPWSAPPPHRKRFAILLKVCQSLLGIPLNHFPVEILHMSNGPRWPGTALWIVPLKIWPNKSSFCHGRPEEKLASMDFHILSYQFNAWPDAIPSQGTYTQSHTEGNLEMPVSLTTCQDCGRNLEQPKETYTTQGEYANSTRKQQTLVSGLHPSRREAAVSPSVPLCLIIAYCIPKY